MNRKKDHPMNSELDVLRVAFDSEEGIYPYRFAAEHAANGTASVQNGAVYKRFGCLVRMGMLERGEPTPSMGDVHRTPYYLTVVGVLALGEADPEYYLKEGRSASHEG